MKYIIIGLVLLLAGCGGDSPKLEDAMIAFRNGCKTKLTAELYSGTWDRGFILKCDDFLGGH